ncbi:MAG: hypothetical protein IJS97_04295 [Prevotella sp.]|nr:hypothetical protein [Prevotella sp.]
MKPALFLRPKPPYLGRDVEAAGHAGGVAVELADVRPVHVEFLGKLLQLRQVVHAALDGYADEIQLRVALVNIHEFGNEVSFIFYLLSGKMIVLYLGIISKFCIDCAKI